MKLHFTKFTLVALTLVITDFMNAQCATNLLGGSASNMFTQVRNATNPVAADKNLNTVVYIHRNNATSFGGSSGNLRYDISTNGGTSFTNDLGVLNPLMTNQARYPNVAIYNPPTNTVAANAYLGYMGATTNTSSGTWNGIVSGVRQLNNSGNTENYNQPSSSQWLIPNSVVKGAPGVFWSVDAVYNGTLITGFRAYKGTWNGSNDITWTTNFTTSPNFNLTYDGKQKVADYNIAFDPTGMNGWISILTHLTPGPANFCYYPVFYKTTDGGNTWSGPIQVDINTYPCMTSILTGTNVLSCGFEHDLTVDVYGNPHMLTTLCNANNAYAVYFGSTHHMFDITSQHGVWTGYDVSNVQAGRGTWGVGTNTVSMDMAPQAGRSADGSKVFFAWSDNTTYTLGAANTSPNLKSRSYDVVQKMWTNVKDFTSCNGTMNGVIYFPHIAEEVLEPSATQWKMAGVYGEYTSGTDPASVCNFRYMNNLIYNSTDYTVSQPTVAVTINQGSSWLNCPGNVKGLSITGAYTEILWTNGAITLSTSVSTPSVYYVTVRNGCSLGSASYTLIGLTANPTANSPSICIGYSSTLSVAGNAYSYTWNPTASTATSIVVSPTATSVYTISATGDGPCVYSNTVNVTVNPLPTISVAGNTAVCMGSSITQTASGATTYTWSSGATGAVVALSPTVNTTYTVNATDANGCNNSATKSITVNPLPVLSGGSSGNICNGNTATLSVNGASTYTWNTGPNTSSITVSPSTTTTYTVNGTNGNGCTNSITITQTVYPLPTVNVSTSNTMLCSGSTATLSGGGTISSFTWSSGGNGSTTQVSPTVTTTYTLSGTDANGCSNSTTFTQSVTICGGINMLSVNNGVMIYPNPNNGAFTIQVNKIVENSEIEITNALGQVVYRKNVMQGMNNVNVTNLSKGVYHYTLIENNLSIGKGKLIIE